MSFCYASQKCTECHGPYKSPWNPKTVDNSSQKGHKRKNDEFFVIPLQNVQTDIFLVNLHRTPKQWGIAHENGPKTQKQRVFGHASQTCTECHGCCKSLRNPKTMANGS
jgi:hypothetical protein